MVHLFHPPGFADDLDPEGLALWHAQMAGLTTQQREVLLCELRQQYPEAKDASVAYIDPTHIDLPDGATVVARAWNGFPNNVLKYAAGGDHHKAWKLAELIEPTDPKVSYVDVDGRALPDKLLTRRLQDEYLEWHADKDKHGITRVTLTCEGPEYWQTLANHDNDLAVKLYSELLGHDVPKADLFFDHDLYVETGGRRHRVAAAGQYNAFNHWNTTDGAIHLTQVANTLGAEINLAMRSTTPRVDLQGKPISDFKQLICCAQYGDPNRNSDPTIGAAANDAVRGGNNITLTNPIGLYIASFDAEQISLPNEAVVAAGLPQAPGEWYRVVRGRATCDDGFARILRIVFEIPDGATMPDGKGGRRPLRLADLEIGGVPVASTRVRKFGHAAGLSCGWWASIRLRRRSRSLRVKVQSNGLAICR